jgi:hypothetical protein
MFESDTEDETEDDTLDETEDDTLDETEDDTWEDLEHDTWEDLEHDTLDSTEDSTEHDTEDDTEDDAEDSTKDETGERCVVCQSRLYRGRREVVEVEPCGHRYHGRCLGKWGWSCPICRGEIKGVYERMRVYSTERQKYIL